MQQGLTLKGITKTFGSVVANNDISIDITRGSIHALVGENGAGKSTLMNILYGLYQPDSGEIVLDGKVIHIGNPMDAIRHGIGMVHQHFKLVSCFTVAENIVLGEEITKNLIVLKQREAEAAIQQLSDRFNLKVDPSALVSDIGVGMQQRVEILKCLYRNAEILILDEPTAVLTPQEIDDLLDIIQELRKNGKTIIFISHKLKEVKRIADFVTVIRHGNVVYQAGIHDITIHKMAEMMVGQSLAQLHVKRVKEKQPILLEMQDVSTWSASGVEVLKKVSLSIQKGKITSLAGVDGNGQAELVDTILGVRRHSAGKIIYDGNDISGHSIPFRREAGISHIPEDRHKNGLILDFLLRENLILGLHRRRKYTRNGVLRQHEVDITADTLIEQFDIRPKSGRFMTRAMSGGNQQKAIIAREVNSNPELIIAVQPTRGLDIGAMRFIREELIALRDQGKAVLLISLDLDEIFLISDTIYVISHGRIVGQADPDTVTRKELGIMMAGISNLEIEEVQE